MADRNPADESSDAGVDGDRSSVSDADGEQDASAESPDVDGEGFHDDEDVHDDEARDETADTDDATDESTTGTDPDRSADSDQTTASSRQDAERTSTSADDAHANAQRAAGVLTILGLWIFWSPILFTGYGMATLLNLALGVGIVVLGSLTVARTGRDTLSAVGLPVVAGVLGAVVAAIPLLFDLSSPTLEASNLVAGVLVALLGVFVAFNYLRSDASTESNRPVTS